MFDDVVVYGFERLAQWSDQLFGQAAEEEATNQVDVAGGGLDDGSLPVGSQPDFGRPPIRGGHIAVDQTAVFAFAWRDEIRGCAPIRSGRPGR